MSTPRRALLERPDWADFSFVARELRTETTGGAILLIAAAVAMVWANTPVSGVYAAISDFVPIPVEAWRVGPATFGLDLSLATWAGDGLLAIFFFVVGVELKRELLAGALRSPARAALPIAAALGGMLVPAAIYLTVVLRAGDSGAVRGWAVPVATDIAFALAVLAVLSTHLPSALRVFLLTLAVVDDMIAIIIIAVFYTADLRPLYLAAALLPLLVFAVLVRRRVTSGALLIPLALVTWLLVHESGVHATIAGVLLGLVVPVARSGSGQRCLASHLEHLWRPVSAGFAVPVFAFFSAGLDLRGDGLSSVFTTPTAVAVMLALVIGKPAGVMISTWLVARFTRAELDSDIGWLDLLGVSFLAGIGFTVALLINELAFVGDPVLIESVRGAIIFGSLGAAILATVVLIGRNRHYRRVEERETLDEDGDGVPDAFQSERGAES